MNETDGLESLKRMLYGSSSKSAIQSLKEYGKKGNSEAYYILAEYYDANPNKLDEYILDQSVERSISTKAMNYYVKAAQMGHIPATDTISLEYSCSDNPKFRKKGIDILLELSVRYHNDRATMLLTKYFPEVRGRL